MEKRNKLIIRADDLGISRGVNYGIYAGIRYGFIRTAGLIINLEDSAHGYELIKDFTHISRGLHCNIVLGSPVTEAAEVPSLVDGEGKFRTSRYYRSAKEDRIVYEEAYLEIRNQVFRFYELTGRLPDYVDYHAACTPTFTRAMEQVCLDLNLLYVPYPEGRIGDYQVKYCELSQDDEIFATMSSGEFSFSSAKLHFFIVINNAVW